MQQKHSRLNVGEIERRARLEIPLITDEEMADAYAESEGAAADYRQLFGDIKGFVMFIGYPRSGHSLIGSLLDAHENIIVAHELDAAKLLMADFERDQIYYLLLENSRAIASIGRRWGQYSYSVPNQWQGRFKSLQIIGDKRGGATTLQIAQHPELMDRLLSTFNHLQPMKFIHVIRNPFDNIATISKKQNPQRRLDQTADFYFRLCRTVKSIKERVGPDCILDVRYPDFIANPCEGLAKICSFLGVQTTSEYLADCSRIVSKSLPRSRHSIDWPPEVVVRIVEQIKEMDFLSGFTFDE